MNKGIVYALISAGILFDIFAALALLRFSSVYARILGSVKCVTTGTLLIMLGVFVADGFSATGVKSLVAGLFILLGAPVAAQATARAARLAARRSAEANKEHYQGIPEGRDRQHEIP